MEQQIAIISIDQYRNEEFAEYVGSYIKENLIALNKTTTLNCDFLSQYNIMMNSFWKKRFFLTI